MKQLGIISVIFMLMAMVTGCKTGFSRGVTNNTFYSNTPKVAIKMAKSFEYVNKEKKDDAAGSQNNSIRQHNFNHESYSFIDYMSRRGSTIEVKMVGERRVHWVMDHTQGFSNYFDAGHEYKQGKRFGFVVATVKDDKNTCQLVKAYSRITGGGNNILLNVYYFEEINENDKKAFDACQLEGKKLSELTPSQRKIYDSFIERCNKDMAFIDPSTVVIKKNK